MSLRYLSICSGIGAASVAWRPLGWQPVAFAEIEPFPCAVLAHHYREVPNLGDITRFATWPDLAIDILVGGTPCQSFSIAGLRGGLADPRGNLTLTFLAILQKYLPPYVLWENVLGVLSIGNGDVFRQFLDGLEELGYIVDVDILDAQWFGLAQRRRRVFVCGQHRDDLLKKKTLSSALTIAQCLTEISVLVLAVARARSATEYESSVSQNSKASDSLRRRMKLFGLDSEATASKLLKLLAALQVRSECGQFGWDSGSGSGNTATSKGIGSQEQETDAEFLNIVSSWNRPLADLLATAKSCITSTSANEITESAIYSCAQTTLRISGLITQSMDSSPSFWSAASSSSIAIKEFIAYARSASSDLFADLGWVRPWHDFIGQVERASDALGNLRVRSFGKVLPLADCVSGDPPPRREAGAGVAIGALAGTSPGGGWRVGGPLDVATAVNAHGGPHGRLDFESETFVATVAGCLGHNAKATGSATNQDALGGLLVAHSLRADGFDASEDGTGRGTPLVPVAFNWQGGGTQTSLGYDPEAGICGTIQADQTPAVAFGIGPDAVDRSGEGAAGNAAERSGLNIVEGLQPTLRARSNNSVATASAVRRLTPLECERLQGFPDGYTAIPYRRKPASDGPRYKALGNSMAVNVVRWIGLRIDAVEAFSRRSAA